MAQVSREYILPARVLNEDDDFVTIEVGKHDDVKFTLQQNEEGEVVGGDRFYTMMFVHMVDGDLEIWKPWEDDS